MSIILLFLGTAGALAAPDLESRLQALLDRTLGENTMAPGLMLWVECPPAGLSWSGAAGHPGFAADAILSPRYTFRIASNTKTYVAVAILKLVQQGGLELDASIAPHLPPEWRRLLADDGYDLPGLTLRRVLSHTAGLNDHSADDRYGAAIMADPQHRWTADEQIARLVEWFDPVGPAGGQYSYSDDGYILLGRILETMTGRNLGQAVRRLIKGEVLPERLLGEMVGSGTADYRLGLICVNLDDRVALGHSGFWNTFAYHVPSMDLTVSGCILNHDAVQGTDLAADVVRLVESAMAADRRP